VSWPTVCVWLLFTALWVASAIEGPFVRDHWSLLTTLLVATSSSYALFTVLHDGVHGAVSESPRWLNEALGRCSLPFITPIGFGAYPVCYY